MPKLTKHEALHCVDRLSGVIDAAANPLNPYGTTAWIRHYIEQVVPDDGEVLALQCDREGRHSLGLFALDAERPQRAGGLGNFYTSLLAPFSSTSTDRNAAAADLVEQLATERPRLAQMNLAPLDADSPDVAALRSAWARMGWYVRPYASFGNCFLPCDGLSFDAYLAGRDSKLRNTVDRKGKKFRQAGSLAILTDPTQVDAAMAAYEAIYAKSWKQPEPYPQFTRGWARACAERGWLRLGVAWLGDVPVAAQVWYVYRGHAYIYKLAYDEEHAKWSAGTVLTAALMAHVLDVDKVVEVDFLSGADPYKMTWMTQQRQRVGLVACNLRTVEGCLLAAREKAAQATQGLRARRADAPAWSRSRA